MFWKLLLAFTIIPAVELYLLVSLGQWIGPLATVLLIVLTGLLGAALAKQEGTAVLAQLRADLGRGIPPASHMVEGVMVFAGGLLLLTPGLLTDITGFALILPFTRKPISPLISAYLLKRFQVRIAGSGLGAAAAAAAAGPAATTAASAAPATPEPSRTAPAPTAEAAGTPFDHPVR